MRYSGAFLIVAFLGAALPALGCSCGNNPPPLEALEQADAVFVGEVMSLGLERHWRLAGSDEQIFGTVHEEAGLHSYRSQVVKLAVEQVWKGIEQGEVTVTSAFECCICGFGFDIGEKYLLYARWDADQKQYSVSACSRSEALSKVADEVAALGKPKRNFLPEKFLRVAAELRKSATGVVVEKP